MTILPDAEAAQEAIEILKAKALNGDEVALHELIALIHIGTDHLRSIALSQPQLTQKVARQHLLWPILAARHPTFAEHYKGLIEKIELGADRLNFSSRAHWSVKNPYTSWALKIMHRINETKADVYFDRKKGETVFLPW